jgi:hypothetical protein
MTNPTAPIAQAIAEGFKLMKTILNTAQARKMRKAIEVGEKYIQVNEGEGQFNYKMDEGKKRDKLRYYKRKFFKYN